MSNEDNSNCNRNSNTNLLRNILDFSTSLTVNSQNTLEHRNERTHSVPIDEEKKKFFYEYIKNITGDFKDDIDVIKTCLEELRSAPADVNRCIPALENIMNLVDHIDVATDFMKLEGLTTMSTFLTSNNSEIVRLAAEIIGISSQNHPTCQEFITEKSDIFQRLLTILESDQYDTTVKTKAVFAISSTIQNNKNAHEKFTELEGYGTFLKILKAANMSLRLRVCFVFDCLCSQFPQIRSMLFEKQFINYLVDLLTSIPIGDSKETVLNTLFTFVEEFYDAIKECRKEKYNLLPTLDYLIAHYKEDEKEEKKKAIRLKEELNRFI